MSVYLCYFIQFYLIYFVTFRYQGNEQIYYCWCWLFFFFAILCFLGFLGNLKYTKSFRT